MDIVLNKEIGCNKTFSRASGVIAFVILTALGAFVRIPLPFSPVPLTLQTFFVLLGAAVLGKERGAAAQSAYIILGAAGLPIFAGAGGGLVYLCGPTAGYLFGFIAASLFIGKMLPRIKGAQVFLVMLTADFLLLAAGSLWLSACGKYSLSQAFFLGFAPFVPGDLCKALAASWIYRKIKTRSQVIFGD